MQEEVGKVINRAQEMTKSLTDALSTLAVPDQAQHVLVSIFNTMNYTLVATLEMAENMIKVAQDAAKNSTISPYVSAGLDQLNVAIDELTKAIKRVSDILSKLREGGEQPAKEGSSWFGAKDTNKKASASTRFS